MYAICLAETKIWQFLLANVNVLVMILIIFVWKYRPGDLNSFGSKAHIPLDTEIYMANGIILRWGPNATLTGPNRTLFHP